MIGTDGEKLIEKSHRQGQHDYARTSFAGKAIWFQELAPKMAWNFRLIFSLCASRRILFVEARVGKLGARSR